MLWKAGPWPLSLNRYTSATPLVMTKIRAGDPAWARGSVIIEGASGPSLIWAGTDVSLSGSHYGNAYRYSLTPETARLLISRGAVEGLERKWTNGPVPAQAVRRVAALDAHAPCAAVIYAGWQVPTVCCEIEFDQAGTILVERGTLPMTGQRFIPCKPLFPGFAVSTAIAGTAAWLTALFLFTVCRRICTSLWRRHRPLPHFAVACPACGYLRTGLASIDPCPECGGDSPAEIAKRSRQTGEERPSRV